MTPKKELQLKFHGRIIDHLGIQMYQSPTAAIAEMVANSWDADAEEVNIILPTSLDSNASIFIKDNGGGMTFVDCEERYLNVGYGRRGDKSVEHSVEKSRPILGRKGIGKFAGFGIAKIVRLETISKITGEKTVFELDIDYLRGQQYVVNGGKVNVVEYLEPDEENKKNHGTNIILKNLTLGRNISQAVFSKSMARRFLLHQRSADFKVLINATELPEAEDTSLIQFVFPRDYRENEMPENCRIEDGWGIETLWNDKTIRWKFNFYEKPIGDDELQGVTIFSHGKLAQAPFFFNLTGGLGGQHGQEYLSGQVEADYLDELETDIIAPERQRINWEKSESIPLLEWGQRRLRNLFELWKGRRAEEKIAILEGRLTPFSQRLSKLPTHEQRIVKRALLKIAAVPTLNSVQFETLAEGLLLAWEGGRLKELTDVVATTEDLSEGELLQILIEANVLTALHTAEAVKAKLLVIAGLHDRIKKQELENAVRDYIANDPWLISPEWETFRKELSINNLIIEAAREAKLERYPDWDRRIDLVLSSGDTLHILEFMRPGLTVDWDHLERFDQYVTAIRVAVRANSGTNFNRVFGTLVADKLSRHSMILDRLERMRKEDMFAIDWKSLLRQAVAKWNDFLNILIDRAPEDDRLVNLATDLEIVDE
jgi:hypothetical protein